MNDDDKMVTVIVTLRRDGRITTELENHPDVPPTLSHTLAQGALVMTTACIAGELRHVPIDRGGVPS